MERTVKASERRIRRRALQTLREWLASDNFRSRAPLNEVWAETSLGEEVRRRQEETGAWWSGEEGEQLKQLCDDVRRCWVENGWVRVETRRLGRPRSADYSVETLNKARRATNFGQGQGYRADSYFRWGESVLGETVNNNPAQLVVIHESVHKALLDGAGADELVGLTRAQVAELLGLTKKYSDRFVRWLLGTGEWKEVRIKDGTTRERVLRRIEL
jgi:hypothetical protein